MNAKTYAKPTSDWSKMAHIQFFLEFFVVFCAVLCLGAKKHTLISVRTEPRRSATILPRFCHARFYHTFCRAKMPKVFDWHTVQELPRSNAPIIVRGWITLKLLEPITGQERQVQAHCTLCNQSLSD